MKLQYEERYSGRDANGDFQFAVSMEPRPTKHERDNFVKLFNQISPAVPVQYDEEIHCFTATCPVLSEMDAFAGRFVAWAEREVKRLEGLNTEARKQLSPIAAKHGLIPDASAPLQRVSPEN